MELLYLWIEDYKNIYRQGFNFSPLYKFEFTPTDFDEKGKVIGGKLEDKMDLKERENKEKFYEDFFNVKNEKDDKENKKGTITNVTAIVGENGSGKSSVLEFIRSSIYEYEGGGFSNRRIARNYICIVKRKDFIIYTKVRIDSSLLIQEEQYYISKQFPNINIVNYSPTISSFIRYEQDFSRNNNIVDISDNYIFYTKSLTKNKDKPYNYLKNIELGKKYKQGVFLNNFELPFFEIKSIQIKRRTLTFDIDSTDIHEEFDFTKILEEERFMETPENYLLFEYQIYYSVYALFAYEISSRKFISNLENSNDEFINPFNILNILKEIITKHKDKKGIGKFKAIIVDLKDYIKKNDYNRNYFDFDFIYDLESLIEFLKEKNFSKNTGTVTIKLSANAYKEFFRLYSSLHQIFDIYFGEKGEIRYLSQGEESILTQLTALHSILKTNFNTNESFTILIDEGELGLHPQWQKQYLKILLETLPKIFPNKQIQLILTSHSPFLVSDLPKENVIFLEKEDTTGLCKVSKLDSMKETFGANIHTLLTDSFFMKGGLVGEFAKSKINWAMELLLEKKEIEPKDKEKIRYIISCIGEPVIRHKLMQLYDEKVKFSVEDRIKQLEEELKKLKG